MAGDVNVIVNLLTPCMLHDSQGLGGGGDMNVIVNLLTPCTLRDTQGLGGMLTALSTWGRLGLDIYI